MSGLGAEETAILSLYIILKMANFVFMKNTPTESDQSQESSSAPCTQEDSARR